MVFVNVIVATLALCAMCVVLDISGIRLLGAACFALHLLTAPMLALAPSLLLDLLCAHVVQALLVQTVNTVMLSLVVEEVWCLLKAHAHVNPPSLDLLALIVFVSSKERVAL